MPNDYNKYNGKNNLDSLTIFNARKYYAENAYVDNVRLKIIDLYNYRYLYGKVDKYNKAIYLSETNLKILPIENKTLFACDFVVDAYVDMLDYFNTAVLKRNIKVSGALVKKPEIEKSWISANKLHHAHMEIIYKMFVFSYLRSNNRDNSINNFDSFVTEFINFSDLIASIMPITRSGYVLSNLCTNNVSGLVIEWSKNLYSVDINKKKIIDDSNFPFYFNAARKFGFYIDKNVPWRLIANVASPIMQNYMEKYGLSKNPGNANDIFDTYFYKAMDKDIELLKNYMFFIYNSYVAAYPMVGSNNKCNKNIQRYQLDKKYFDNNYDNVYWINVYFQIRLSESNVKIEKEQKDILVKRAISIYDKLGMVKSMEYIEQQINLLKK